VKPPPFDYAAPTTLGEALELLSERGDVASILAGGQSLVPMLNLRILRPELVIDVNRITGLDGVSAADGKVRLGATVRLASLERVEALPGVLRDAIGHVAHPQIRNRTTIGGSIAHADPASELPATIVALGGTIVLSSLSGERLVRAEEFFRGPFSTARRSDELVTEIRLDTSGEAKGVFLEFARRRGDFAIVGVCAVRAGGEARLSACGASPAPVLLRRAAEAWAAGEAPTQVAELASDEVDPWDDLHANTAYRRHLVGILVRRALEALPG
jgi:carbon-monoxide dehydrogenase medium subunit